MLIVPRLMMRGDPELGFCFDDRTGTSQGEQESGRAVFHSSVINGLDRVED